MHWLARGRSSSSTSTHHAEPVSDDDDPTTEDDWTTSQAALRRGPTIERDGVPVRRKKRGVQANRKHTRRLDRSMSKWKRKQQLPTGIPCLARSSPTARELEAGGQRAIHVCGYYRWANRSTSPLLTNPTPPFDRSTVHHHRRQSSLEPRRPDAPTNPAGPADHTLSSHRLHAAGH